MAELRSQLSHAKTPWRNSRIFEDVGVAIQTNHTPTEFWMLDQMDQAYYIAYHRTVATIEEFKAEKERQKQARMSKRKRF